jgi:hypothetical protein
MNKPSEAKATIRKANADYTVVDRSPLTMKAGEIVDLGVEDKAWAGWVWVTNKEGRGTYLPAAALERLGAAQAKVLEDFEAVDLSVGQGEAVTVLREVSGWFWCRSEAGLEGWVPDYVLS